MISNNLSIAVIGLGYVGLPLAIEFSKKYKTIGFDKNSDRINELNNFNDKTLEVDSSVFKEIDIKFTKDLNDIADCDVYIISVPTPVDKNKKPDMSPLLAASKSVGGILNKGNVVVYESTVYPGATEEFCVPILEKESTLKYNKEFYCGYSPERINPGDKEHSLPSIIKITSGSNDEISEFIDTLYSSIIPAGTHKANSIAVAEAAKVIENIQRDVNIALINELSIIFDKLGLDTNEVLEAAGTKWNFLPFRPGLVGGHCIGVDPYYLTYKSQKIGYQPEMILAGRKINDQMGEYIADTAIFELNKLGINPKDSTIAIFGVTFKENCPDIRNTKVIDIIHHLKLRGCKIVAIDPFANKEEVKLDLDLNLIDLGEISNIDAAIIAVAHDKFIKIKIKEWLKIFKNKGIFIDVKSIKDKYFFENSSISHWRL
jgi:UDP-N-acetyl-D-galactosamine dehydrogenase